MQALARCRRVVAVPAGIASGYTGPGMALRR